MPTEETSNKDLLSVRQLNDLKVEQTGVHATKSFVGHANCDMGEIMGEGYLRILLSQN